jgi:glycosyltransferase involved in cell wall biosynthesis
MGDRLNVTHVVLSLDVGGLERNVVNQIREGSRLGQRVSVLCLERPGKLAPTAEALGARVLCVDKKPGLRPALLAPLRLALRALRPDVVHTHHVTALFYTGPVAFALGVPVVVHTEHGRYDYAGRWLFRCLGKFAATFAQRFYCLTQDMATAVAAQQVVSRRKLRLIENGICTEDYTTPCDSAAVRRSLGIPASAPVIGTVGRLEEIKRQDLLLRAVARLRSLVPEVHLLLVGEGSRRHELQRLAEQLGVAHCVHFAGYQERTPPYLQAMTCFALTSRSEGMPQSVLEACATGLPVIASYVGGLPEVIAPNRTGLLFPEGDEDALTDGLLVLLTDAQRARQLADAGHAAVTARFDLRRMAREYHHDFLALLGRRVPSSARGGPISPRTLGHNHVGRPAVATGWRTRSCLNRLSTLEDRS